MKRTCLLLALTSSLPLSAQFITPDWEGQPNSEYSEWDLFTHASIEPNSPDISSDSPTHDATVTCSTTSAFITSSNNIYSFLSALSFQIDDSTNFDVANVLVQVFSQGSELDLTSLQLIPADATGPEDILTPTQAFLIDQNALDNENGGFGSSYVIQWDLSAAPLTGGYSILFSSEESSMSLDKISLHTSDTFTLVAAPATELITPTLALSGNDIVISWPLDAGENLVLQQCSDLSLPDSWVAISETPNESETHYEISLPIGSSPSFFRLSEAASTQ